MASKAQQRSKAEDRCWLLCRWKWRPPKARLLQSQKLIRRTGIAVNMVQTSSEGFCGHKLLKRNSACLHWAAYPPNLWYQSCQFVWQCSLGKSNSTCVTQFTPLQEGFPRIGWEDVVLYRKNSQNNNSHNMFTATRVLKPTPLSPHRTHSPCSKSLRFSNFLDVLLSIPSSISFSRLTVNRCAIFRRFQRNSWDLNSCPVCFSTRRSYRERWHFSTSASISWMLSPRNSSILVGFAIVTTPKRGVAGKE